MKCTRAAGFLLLLALPGLALARPADRPPRAAMEADEARRPSPEELSDRLRRGGSLFLESHVFDPLVDPPPSFASGRAVTGRERVFLVQFTRDLTAADRRQLEDEGIRFVDYVPSRAYLVRAEPATFPRLRAHGLVRWLDAFRGGYKVAGVLRSDAWEEDLFLELRLLPDENPIELMDRLRALDSGVALAAVQGEIQEGATLRVLVPAGRLHPFVERAADDAAVWSVQPWYLPELHNDDAIWVEQSFDTVNQRTYALTAPLWNHGITGTGQLVGVSDTGLDSDMCFFRTSASGASVTDSQAPALPGTGTIDLGKKVAAYYVLPNATPYDGNTLCGTRAENWHGTHTTGTIVGDNFLTLSTAGSGGHDPGDGMAPNAKVIFQDAGSEVSGCLDGLSNDFGLIAQQAYDAGVRVHSNSWGSSAGGAYTSSSAGVDAITYDREDLLFVFSAGNSGSGANTIGSPATAKSCVAVGATGHGASSLMASFSSRGPTDDGRIKPDVVAPGSATVSAAGDTSHTSGNCSTKTLSGTSMSAPTVAGGAVLLRQYFADGFYPTGAKAAADAVNPTAALLKAALVNGAIDIAATGQATMLASLTPNNNQGFGRIQLDNVAFFSTPSRDARRTRVWDKWNETGLATGEMDAYALQVAAGQPLKVALAWTDPQGSLVAATKLVNDLDLEVVDPSSNVYRGNVFSAGQSAPGGFADLLNTVEVFFLTNPAPGTWTLRVRASNVPGTPAEPYSDRQGYALVATYGDCAVGLAAPAGLVASDQGEAGIQLSWAPVPGASGYQVYRASGACGAPGTLFHYLAQTATAGFTDALLQGGFGYAYKVRAVTACGEGPLSGCAAATSTAGCTLFPSFEGLSSAVNDTATAGCDTLLQWDAGESACPGAPGIRYDVYRSTTPYFTPGPGSLLAAGEPTTSYRDSAVTPNRAYFYRVLAEDATTGNGGPANGGNLDQNAVVRGVTPTASSTYPGTWSDDADFAARLIAGDPWRISSQSNHTGGGTLAYHSAPDGSTVPALTCAAVTTPPIPLQAGQSPTLHYWTRYNLELQWDGVVVEISTDGGSSWNDLPPVGGYPSSFALTQNPPINECDYPATHGAFSGLVSDWTPVTHDLGPYAGQTVLLRWQLSTDPATEFEGFYLDDIAVTQALAPASCGTDLRLASLSLTDSCPSGGGQANGVLEAGEDATLVLGVQNIGENGATAVSGTLSSPSSDVVITGATAAFGAAQAGELVLSGAPHFAVWVSPDVLCGTVLPFSLQLDSAQGSFTRTFELTVGSQSNPCQVTCGEALPVENGTAADLLRVGKTAGGDPLELTFGLSCHTTDSTVYWGQSAGSMTGIAWTGAACGFGPQGAATISPGTPPAGSFLYFVAVPTSAGREGSYGRSSSGLERPAASGLPACNAFQQLGGVCP